MNDVEIRQRATVLRRAAVIMRQRSTKPNGFWLNILCRILTDAADKEEAQASK